MLNSLDADSAFDVDHEVTVKIATFAEHSCDIEGNMYYPRCSCGWNGAYMTDRVDAKVEGTKHVEARRRSAPVAS